MIHRREFLRLLGTSSVGLALAACGVTPTPTETPAPTAASRIVQITATPWLVTATPAPTNTATATPTRVPEVIPGVVFPTQDIVDAGYKKCNFSTAPDIKNLRPVEVRNLKFDVRKNLNHPDQIPIVFAGDPKTNEIVLATRLNPQTKEYEWHVAGLRDLADALEIRIGSNLENKIIGMWDLPPDITNNIVRNSQEEFNLAIIDSIAWALTHQPVSSTDKVIQNFKYLVDADVASALSSSMEIRFEPLLYGSTDFEWIPLLKQLKRDASSGNKLKGYIKDRIVQVVDRYGGEVNQLVVTLEAANPDDGYRDILGLDYIPFAFKTTRQALKDKKVTAELMYDHDETFSDTSENLKGRQIAFNLLKTIEDGDYDTVGLEGHIFVEPDQVQMWLDKERIKKVLQLYKDRIPDGKSIKVTSIDVDLKKITSPDRFEIQAQIYRTFIQACLEFGITHIGFWTTEGGDAYSWLVMQGNENWWYSTHADPTLFGRDFNPLPNPKPAYFAVKTLLSQMMDKTHG